MTLSGYRVYTYISVPSTPGDPELLMSIVSPYFGGLCFLVQTASQFLRSKNRPHWASLVAQTVKNLPAIWETWIRSLGWKNSPGEGNGYSLQYSYLENPRDTGA